ncbi:MAG: FecR domain-containing protein [Turneriella sp.]|nr:FecR domain-containing protein [Turneriella sp.]
MRLYEKKTAAPIRFFAVSALVLCLFALQGISADGRFVSMHGKVQVFENGRWAKAEMSSKLTEQSSVQVGYRSGAVVGLKDGSQIAMKPNSVVSFNHLSDDVKKPRSEIFVVQGGLSAFVKKPEGNAKHVFHIRTPTMIVGVRGSFMELSKNGELHQVTAVQSPAFIRNDPTAATTRERLQKAFAVLERAYLMDRDEKLRVERRIREAKVSEDAEAFRTIVNPTFATAEIREGIKDINDHKTLVRELIVRQRKVYAVSERQEIIRTMLSVRALTLLQLAWAEAAYRAELEAHLIAMKQNEKKKQETESDEETFLNTLGLTLIPQGDSASASGDIRGPLYQRTFDARAERNFGAGISTSEQQFLGGNTDSQAGFGNDVQGLYNSINSVTQPSANGDPTLQKF